MEGPMLRVEKLFLNDQLLHVMFLIIDQSKRIESTLLGLEHSLQYFFLGHTNVVVGGAHAFPES